MKSPPGGAAVKDGPPPSAGRRAAAHSVLDGGEPGARLGQVGAVCLLAACPASLRWPCAGIATAPRSLAAVGPAITRCPLVVALARWQTAHPVLAPAVRVTPASILAPLVAGLVARGLVFAFDKHDPRKDQPWHTRRRAFRTEGGELPRSSPSPDPR